MTRLAVLTPSYAPDLELCRDLNRSLLEWAPPDAHHHVIVPRRDGKRFAGLRGPRTDVWTIDELLPRRMLALPVVNAWLNLRRPYPPVRGWAMQQLVKLHAAAELDVDLLVLADSDVVFVRPVSADTFREGRRVRYYRRADAVHAGMPRHVLWHDVARRLLGLPAADPPPLPDYISPLNAWDRGVVQALRDRIERVTGRPWLEAIGSELHFSEFILYGVFVEGALGSSAEAVAADSMFLHTYWASTPLAPRDAEGFVRGLTRDDVAVMISAKSHTPLDVRRTALASLSPTDGTVG